MKGQQNEQARPPDEQGATPFPFDIGCLTVEQRELWDEWFARLAE